jgi:hypothetical protein
MVSHMVRTIDGGKLRRLLTKSMCSFAAVSQDQPLPVHLAPVEKVLASLRSIGRFLLLHGDLRHVLGRELRCCELCLVRRLSLCLGHSVGRGALGIGRSSTALRGLLLGGALAGRGPRVPAPADVAARRARSLSRPASSRFALAFALRARRRFCCCRFLALPMEGIRPGCGGWVQLHLHCCDCMNEGSWRVGHAESAQRPNLGSLEI